MPCLRRRSACWVALAVLLATIFSAAADDSSFPFGSELMLDAQPMPGSKRIPILQIDDNGATTIDLWCASLRADATVGEGTITIVPGPIGTEQCTPERQSRDADLLTALSLVTNWQRHGDAIELTGATTLHFHLMTN